MKTTLKRFKVINFRSIEESDWIAVGENTCLVGTNEAGKSNLLIALWKLNPANDESIRPLADYPRHLYSKYKAEGHEKDVFIEADFKLDKTIQDKLAKDLSCDPEQARVALVKRKYSGTYKISLPYSKVESYPLKRVDMIVTEFRNMINNSESYIKESDEFKAKISSLLDKLSVAPENDFYSESDINTLISSIDRFMSAEFGKRQNLPLLFETGLLKPLNKILDAFKGKEIQTTKESRQLILNSLPKFVYYSDYGNLDSEIYLPRVIEDLERSDLSESARAKARTLNVLAFAR